jgi:hypothetical protein
MHEGVRMFPVSDKLNDELTRFGNRSSIEILLQSKAYIFDNLILPKLTHHIIFQTTQQCNVSNEVVLFS